MKFLSDFAASTFGLCVLAAIFIPMGLKVLLWVLHAIVWVNKSFQSLFI